MDGVLMLWRARLRQHMRSLLFLTLLVAIGGGMALACIAGARRTASSFDRMASAAEFPDIVSSHLEDPERATAIADGLDGVTSHTTQVGFVGFVEDIDPTFIKYFIGSWDELRHQRPILEQGRYPDPARVEEVVAIGRGAEAAGFSPGDEIAVTFFKPDFSGQVTERFTLVGLGADVSEVVSDTAQDRSALYFTPAFTRQRAAELRAWSSTRLAVAPGAEDAVFAELVAVGWPADETIGVVRGRVEDAIGPLVVTLLVLGTVVLLATLVLAGHALARQADGRRSEVDAVRALGFTRSEVRTVELLTVAAVGVPSAVLAALVAVALSPWFPIGGVRALEPQRGVDADVFVLVPGALVILIVLVAVERVAGGRSGVNVHRRAVPLDGVLAATPPAIGTGLLLAVGRSAAERRRFWTTAVTASAALALVLGAIGFVGSLTRLSDEPERYGVGWELTARNAFGDIDADRLRAAVADAPEIIAVSSAALHKVVLDEQLVPALGVLPVTGPVWPTVLEGRVPRSDDEVLVGSAVLDRLNADIGDTVSLRSESFPGVDPDVAFDVEIVGAAVFPAIDVPGLDPTRLNEGMAMTWDRYLSLVPDGYDAGPDVTFFDLADGADPQAVISRFSEGLPQGDFGAPTEWLPSLAPSEVVESEAARGLIWTVIGLLGVILIGAVGHGMATTVRRRWGDYAVLKALGFTRRQVLTAVTAQSTVTIAAALVVGVPLGVVLGRWTWRLFAHDMGVIEAPVVQVVPILIAAVVAVVAATVITFGPARRVGRASPAVTLRTE